MPKKNQRRGKLNLTVTTDHKTKAEKPAQTLGRSKSNLFEFLIDQEWNASLHLAPKKNIREAGPRKKSSG